MPKTEIIDRDTAEQRTDAAPATALCPACGEQMSGELCTRCGWRHRRRRWVWARTALRRSVEVLVLLALTGALLCFVFPQIRPIRPGPGGPWAGRWHRLKRLLTRGIGEEGAANRVRARRDSGARRDPAVSERSAPAPVAGEAAQQPFRRPDSRGGTRLPREAPARLAPQSSAPVGRPTAEAVAGGAAAPYRRSVPGPGALLRGLVFSDFRFSMIGTSDVRQRGVRFTAKNTGRAVGGGALRAEVRLLFASSDRTFHVARGHATLRKLPSGESHVAVDNIARWGEVRAHRAADLPHAAHVALRLNGVTVHEELWGGAGDPAQWWQEDSLVVLEKPTLKVGVAQGR